MQFAFMLLLLHHFMLVMLRMHDDDDAMRCRSERDPDLISNSFKSLTRCLIVMFIWITVCCCSYIERED